MPRLNRSNLIDGRILVLVVVVGGLLLLHGADKLDAAKSVYLVCAAAAAAAALLSVPWWLSGTHSAVARPWVFFSGAALALLILSLAVSRAQGTPLTSWLRDAASYGLMAATPILALACARVASRRWLIAVLAVCGALASISFTVEWIGRRHLAHLPIDRIALPSEPLAAALLAVATAIALAGVRRRLWWAAIGGAVLGLFFVTGTRSTLLLLIVPVGMAVLAGRPWRPSVMVVLAEVVIAVAVFLAGESTLSVANGASPIASWPFVGGTPSASGAALTQRVTTVAVLLTDPGADPSFQERLLQTKLAWDTFKTSPLVGVAPGYAFHLEDSGTVALTLDTPLDYLAKFGVLGLGLLALFVVAYLRLTLQLWRRRQAAPVESLTLVGFTLVLLVIGVQYFPIEDKGASLALILVLALGLQGLLGARGGDPAGAQSVATGKGDTGTRGAEA
jgi:hypothetical protein